jgi:hypothetical protein
MKLKKETNWDNSAYFLIYSKVKYSYILILWKIICDCYLFPSHPFPVLMLNS